MARHYKLVKITGGRQKYMAYEKLFWAEHAPSGFENMQDDTVLPFGEHQVIGREGDDFWIGTKQGVWFKNQQDRATNLMQRMNDELPEHEWKSHWIYKLAHKIFWIEEKNKFLKTNGG